MKKLIIGTKNKGDFETVATTIRMPRNLVQKIDDVAKVTGYTRNEIAIKCFEFAIENMEVSSRVK